MTELKIPVEELSTVLNKAILDSLSAETKERLIEGALQYMLTAPATGRYGEKEPSPLQRAFNQALNNVAYQVAEQLIETGGTKEKLVDAFATVVADIPEVDSDWQLQRYLMDAVLKRAREIREGN